ncbi:secretion protein F [Maledivibacter halophilus]|uniref:Tight adherence protein C n=1 Tax=Maledivibacter halophilus TaxID=36842 RepID=A0A1T5LP12_9FIRM|nr:secretion protein F [Maledivibacter halophilus]SKC77664.1 tight adherence protein C [Maledivibacter halophilus]
MIKILILFALSFSTGLFLILSDVFKIPSKRADKVYLTVSKKGNKKPKVTELIVVELSEKVGRYIRLGRYKKRKLMMALKSANISLTPETFIAKAYVKGGLTLLCVVPALLIFPILSPIILVVSILIYFKEINSADEILKKSRSSIEYELPRFVSTLTQELQASRDVLSILDNYKNNTSGIFKRELEITVADMKTGNVESALTRFETRIGSSMLSDVVRGLIGVIRGDNNVVYFQMLSHDFKQLELQRLKAEVMKRPGKIRRYSMLMLGCFIMMYLTVMMLQIVENMGKLF